MNRKEIIRKAGVIVNITFIIALGCLFVYAAATKIVNQSSFQSSLQNSPLVTGWSVKYIGWGVPTVCLLSVIGLAIALFRPGLMRWALAHYALWLVAFTAYITLIITVAPYKPCSCIGLTERWSWEQHLLINGGLLALVLFVGLWPFRYNDKNVNVFAAADEAPSQPLKNGKYLKGKEV